MIKFIPYDLMQKDKTVSLSLQNCEQTLIDRNHLCSKRIRLTTTDEALTVKAAILVLCISGAYNLLFKFECIVIGAIVCNKS